MAHRDLQIHYPVNSDNAITIKNKENKWKKLRKPAIQIANYKSLKS